MTLTKLTSLNAVAELISDNTVISVSSSSALGCPDATLKAIGERFVFTMMPENLLISLRPR